MQQAAGKSSISWDPEKFGVRTLVSRLMQALGSKDGREIVLEIEALRDQGLVDRLEDGDYYLKK